MILMRRGFSMRRFWLGIAMGLTAVAVASAELPKSFRGWESSGAETISTPQLAGAAGNDAAVIREYGFLGAERRQYAKGNSKLSITLWRMQDATGSFGLYTYYTTPGMTGEKQADDQVASRPDLYLLQRGPYLLEIAGEGFAPADARELGAAVPQPSVGRESVPPPLPGFLPENSVIPQSQKFLIGPAAFSRLVDRIPPKAIQFELGAEAALAQYRFDGKDAKLLLVSYPTPQLAAKMLRSFQALPALAQQDSGKTLFIERKGSLVAFVMDAPNLAAAEKLLGLVTYSTDVTWNQYVAPASENVGTVMMAIFSLAGFLLLFSFVAGVAFGGVRVLTKRFIPIPIFDRPSQLEITQLNITNR
jgi:uncharacterized protein DUF6599